MIFNKAHSENVPIKEKKLKCLHTSHNENTAKVDDYLYLIFSDNGKTVDFYHLGDKDINLWADTKIVNTSLYYITMRPEIGLSSWYLNRENGLLDERFSGERHEYGQCVPIDKGDDPIKTLEDLAKERKQKIKDKIKF